MVFREFRKPQVLEITFFHVTSISIFTFFSMFMKAWKMVKYGLTAKRGAILRWKTSIHSFSNLSCIQKFDIRRLNIIYEIMII